MSAAATHSPEVAVTTAVRYGLYRAMNSFDAADADAPARVVVAIIAEKHSLVVSLTEADIALANVGVPLDLATGGDYTVFDNVVYAVDEILFNRGMLAAAPFAEKV